MANGFDPYQAWLGVSKDQGPINVYGLLGLPLAESDGERIEEAAAERLALLEEQRRGPHGAQAEKLIEMVREGFKVLQDPKKKEKYDARLLERRAAAATSDTPTPSAETTTAALKASAVKTALKSKAAPPVTAPPKGTSVPKTATPGVQAVAAPLGGPPPIAAVPASRPAIAAGMPKTAGVPMASAAPVGSGVPTPAPGGAVLAGRSMGGPPLIAVAASASGGWPVVMDRPSPSGATVATPAKPVNRAEEKARQKQQQLMLVGGLLAAMVVLVGAAIYVATLPPTVAKKTPAKSPEAEATTTLANLDPAVPRQPAKSVEPSEKQAAVDGKRARSLRKGADRNANSAGDKNALQADAAMDAAAAPLAASAPVPTEPESVPWAVSADANPSPPPPLDPGLASIFTPGFTAKCFAIDAAGKTAALAAETGQIAVFDLVAKTKKGSFALTGERVLALALLGPDRVLVWSDPSGLQTFNAADGTTIASWAGPVVGPEAGAVPEAGIAVSPGEKFVAIARQGIRFYDAATGTLVGVATVPAGGAVAVLGFDPDGQRLRAVIQSDRSHRIVDFNLATGEAVSEGTKPCPGELGGVGLRGPLYTRSGTGGRFLFCGKYVLKADDGFPALRIDKPPTILFPLVAGALWTSEGGPIENTRLDWDKIVRAVQTFDTGRAPAQIGPGVSIAVKIDGEGLAPERLAAVTEHVTATLAQRFEGYGMSVNEFASTTCLVKYKEEAAGRLSNLRYLEADGNALQKPADLEGVRTSVELTIVSSDVGKESIFKYNVELPANNSRMAAPLEYADKPPADAYLAARLDWLAEQLDGLDLPYYLSKGILGTTKLPIVVPRVTGAAAATAEAR